MNYRHLYHAGNFADVFKHIILVALLESLQKKENAFCFLETHAGAGSYDLTSSAAQKGKEFENGIFKLISEKNKPPLVETYLSIVRQNNPDSTDLRFYPGSPYFAKQLLRPQDRMILSELHKETFLSLKKYIPPNKQIALHHQDGYETLNAFLPPKERRGLVLIDPPYEQSDESTTTIKQLVNALQRFETGIYALWYPIKTRAQTDTFHRKIQSQISRPTLSAELSIFPEDTPTHLNGSGMLIVNPPWLLDNQLKIVLPWLLSKLNVSHGQYKLKFIVK